MPNVTLSFNVKRATGLLNSSQLGTEAGRYLLNALQEAVSGLNQCDGILYNVNEAVALGSDAYAGPAIGGLSASGGAGSVGGSVCGTAITVTWGTSDTASMTALAAAIRASSAVNKRVTATNVSMKVTLATVTAGQYIEIAGVRFTAVNGTPANFGEFDMSGTDTQDAASLCLAINRHPSTAMRWRAVNVAGAVFVFPTTNRTIGPTQDKFACICNTGSFTTFTVNQAVPAAGTVCAVIALQPGDLGNEARLTASGTGMTAVTNGSAGFLGHGTGSGTTNYLNVP